MGQERDVLFASAKGTDASRVKANWIHRCVYSPYPIEVIDQLFAPLLNSAFLSFDKRRRRDEGEGGKRARDDSCIKAMYLLQAVICARVFIHQPADFSAHSLWIISSVRRAQNPRVSAFLHIDKKISSIPFYIDDRGLIVFRYEEESVLASRSIYNVFFCFFLQRRDRRLNNAFRRIRVRGWLTSCV